MGNISRIIRNCSIRNKLLVYFLLLTLLPLSTLGVLGSMIYSRVVEDSANVHTSQMIVQVKKNIDFYISSMESIINYIYMEPYLIEFMNTDSSNSYLSNVLEPEIKRILQNFAQTHNEIAGIMIVNSNSIYISNEMHAISRDSLTIESWYNQAAASPENIQLISNPIGRNIATNRNYSADDVFSVVKAFKNPNSGECMGVILVDIKLNIIEDAINDVTFGKKGFLFVIDSNNNIVYAPVNPVIYRVKGTWMNNSSNSVVKDINNNVYQIIYKNSDYTGWKTVGVFSLDEALEKVHNIRYYSILIGICTLALSFSVSLFFSSTIARPVSKLKKLMNLAEEGNLDVRFKSKSNDEIGQLGDSFNNMIEKIKKLIELVYIEQKNKREAELKSLQAQIKPHFLYNTLDTIQWIAQDHDAPDIMEIVGALTKLFRISLSKGREMIKVREELDHVRSYLIIQKARYEDKLEYEINAKEGLMDYIVPKLILQPIVENSIYHGIKAKEGAGKIVVDVERLGNNLIFKVRDNGIGIIPEKLSEIQVMLNNRDYEINNPGYGIYNVNERIRLSFGNAYGLKFYSIYGDGTIVEIVIPVIKE